MKAGAEKSNQASESRANANRVSQPSKTQGTSYESQEMDINSPRLQAQAALQERITNSPRMVAQRQQLERMFGGEVQKKDNKTGIPDNLKTGVETTSSSFTGRTQVRLSSS